MSPRVYDPDHTAHIRRRLTRMAVTGLIGLAVAAAAAGVLAVVGSLAGDSSGGLVTAAWVADAVCAAVGVLYLLATLAAWAVYRRRRADLDAEGGAEIVGEMHAASPTVTATGEDAPWRDAPAVARHVPAHLLGAGSSCCPPNSVTAMAVGWSATAVGQTAAAVGPPRPTGVPICWNLLGTAAAVGRDSANSVGPLFGPVG